MVYLGNSNNFINKIVMFCSDSRKNLLNIFLFTVQMTEIKECKLFTDSTGEIKSKILLQSNLIGIQLCLVLHL